MNRSLRYSPNSAVRAAEVFPHATAVLLAGHLPGGVSKVVFRRWVLRENGVDEACLPTLDRVDAALAALAGVLALTGGHSVVSDPDEGVILLPVPARPADPTSRIGRDQRHVEIRDDPTRPPQQCEHQSRRHRPNRLHQPQPTDSRCGNGPSRHRPRAIHIQTPLRSLRQRVRQQRL